MTKSVSRTIKAAFSPLSLLLGTTVAALFPGSTVSAQTEYKNIARPPSISASPIDPTIEAQQTKVGKGVSPLDVLLTERAIRENWANYSMLDDGDGVVLRQEYWAKFSFTKDYKWVWYDAAGRTIGEVGLENFQRPPLPGVVQRPWKHLPITIKFDQIDKTSARTRTVVLFMAVPKATKPNQPDGAEGLSTAAVPQAGMAVYHERWRKEDGIWLKASSVVYSANCGWFPTPVGEFNCVDPAVTAQPKADKR